MEKIKELVLMLLDKNIPFKFEFGRVFVLRQKSHFVPVIVFDEKTNEFVVSHWNEGIISPKSINFTELSELLTFIRTI